MRGLYHIPLTCLAGFCPTNLTSQVNIEVIPSQLQCACIFIIRRNEAAWLKFSTITRDRMYHAGSHYLACYSRGIDQIRRVLLHCLRQVNQQPRYLQRAKTSLEAHVLRAKSYMCTAWDCLIIQALIMKASLAGYRSQLHPDHNVGSTWGAKQCQLLVRMDANKLANSLMCIYAMTEGIMSLKRFSNSPPFPIELWVAERQVKMFVQVAWHEEFRRLIQLVIDDDQTIGGQPVTSPLARLCERGPNWDHTKGHHCIHHSRRREVRNQQNIISRVGHGK
jgi:hypothetical protein